MPFSILIAAAIATSQARDVNFSFAFFGCNRLEKEDWDPISNPSSANLPQLRRTLADIDALTPRPKLLFAVGDLVLGYADDQGETVKKQLDAWIGEFRKSTLSGHVTLIPVAGNHEMNRKVGKDKVESPHTTAVWNDWLTRNHLEPARGNGPRAGGEVADDQSRLNFSFDRSRVHFTVVNTDARCVGGAIAWVPWQWARNDVSAANKAHRLTFVIGHRNLLDPTTTTGDSPIDAGARAELLETVRRNSNVVGYLCAHVHASEVQRFDHSAAWQVIAGNGGSKLEDDWNPAGGRTFGFAVVTIFRSGQIVLSQYARPADASPNPRPAALVGTTVLREAPDPLVKPADVHTTLRLH